MQLFHCAHCENLVYFENHQCVNCGHALAYLPDHRRMASLEGTGAEKTTPAAPGQRYRLCANYTRNNTCNWAVPADSLHLLCEACRFTRVIPDLSLPEWHTAWYKLEVAKRRVLYEIAMLGLPLVSKADDEVYGLAFEFLADSPSAPVMTGHENGVITIALVEADDAERERRRLQLHEPYRTLLGHFRHEIGHYYWDRLIRDRDRLGEFRESFGDERADYASALQAHYATGVPRDWSDRFISAYASTHPWEDWAETWTHYLHMRDSLETAEATGVQVASRLSVPAPAAAADEFDAMRQKWHGLTHTLNNLNRSLGLHDAYPFVLSPPAVAKMRFVHQTIVAAGVRSV